MITRGLCSCGATNGSKTPGKRRGLAHARAGIQDFHWHDLRHTWASWHVMSGTPLEVLMELGGWSDLRMVMRYAHLSPGHVARFADSLRPSDSDYDQTMAAPKTGTP